MEIKIFNRNFDTPLFGKRDTHRFDTPQESNNIDDVDENRRLTAFSLQPSEMNCRRSLLLVQVC